MSDIKITGVDWGETSVTTFSVFSNDPNYKLDYINTLNNNKQIGFEKFYQQDWFVNMGTFYTRIKDELMNPHLTHGRRDHRNRPCIMISIEDLEDLMRDYERLDSTMRASYEGLVLKDDPIIINKPKEIINKEKEITKEFIRMDWII